MRPLKPSVKASLEAAATRYHASIGEAAEYLASRGISPATAERHRLGVVVDPLLGHERFAGRLSIPNINGIGDVVGMKFRALHGEEPKYDGLSLEARLFHTRAIPTAGEWICLTEGELDCIILDQCGLPAVGVPGANGWKDHYARVFAGFETVYVFPDPDAAGTKMGKDIAKRLESALIVNMAEDVNDTYVHGGKDAVLDAMREAGWSE